MIIAVSFLVVYYDTGGVICAHVYTNYITAPAKPNIHPCIHRHQSINQRCAKLYCGTTCVTAQHCHTHQTRENIPPPLPIWPLFHIDGSDATATTTTDVTYTNERSWLRVSGSPCPLAASSSPLAPIGCYAAAWWRAWSPCSAPSRCVYACACAPTSCWCRPLSGWDRGRWAPPPRPFAEIG